MITMPDYRPGMNGIIIGLLSSFGSAILIGCFFLIFYFFRCTTSGRIFLDRIGRPGEYDDEQQFLREEAEALETMDDMQRTEYLRAKGKAAVVAVYALFATSGKVLLTRSSLLAFIAANPPESLQTDISLSQYLAIQEKGVSAWEFEPELEIANCFVEARTEIEFFDSECTVMSNLPVPKQNEVYYWEAKIYDKPENTLISIGMATKPYPLFRLPGWYTFVTILQNKNTNEPFRLSQVLCRVPIQRNPSLQSTFQCYFLRPASCSRRCYWRRLPPAKWHDFLYPKRKEVGGCSTRFEVAKLLPLDRRERTLHRPCQLWSGWLCLHRSQCQEVGSRPHDWFARTATAIWFRARQYSPRGRHQGWVYQHAWTWARV